jgi:pyruvate kinase
VSARNGVNVTYARPNLPAITDKDAADLAVAVEAGADFVALSFVRGAADILNLRDRLRGLGSPARTIEKIEKIEAHEHLDEILAVSDGVMVARGDYGVEAGMARVPLMQKDTIARATNVGKLVITATQMLESMIHPPEPTRAEAVDVAALIIPTATGGGLVQAPSTARTARSSPSPTTLSCATS